MKRILPLLFILAIMLPSVARQQPEWALRTCTGECVKVDQVDYLLAADDRPLFTIVMKGGTTIDGVSRVTVEDVSGVTTVQAKEQISLFPNPVQEYLTISGMESGTQVRILSIDGMPVKSLYVTDENTTISVNDLQQGYYLLQTPHSTLKFIKK